MTFGAWCFGIAIATTFFGATQLADAAESCDKLDGCAARACRIDAQIAEAQAGVNARRLPALERDRAEIAHCSDEGLKQKRKVALDQAQKRIDLREADLEKAKAKGDPAKIKTAQRRLESARHAYTVIQNSPL